MDMMHTPHVDMQDTRFEEFEEANHEFNTLEFCTRVCGLLKQTEIHEANEAKRTSRSDS